MRSPRPDLPPRIALRLRTLGRSLRRDTRGATAIEYGLILALVVLTLIASLEGLADVTTSMWGNINAQVTKAS